MNIPQTTTSRFSSEQVMTLDAVSSKSLNAVRDDRLQFLEDYLTRKCS